MSEELFFLVDGRLFCHRKKPVMISDMPSTKDKARANVDIILRKLFPTAVIVVF